MYLNLDYVPSVKHTITQRHRKKPSARPSSLMQPTTTPIQNPTTNRIASRTSSSNHQQALNPPSEEHTHVWKHAAYLYRTHSLHEAANIFSALSHAIANPSERAKCLVNAGLIQAHQGHYILANRSFEAAADSDPNLLIATYLTAVMSCELGDYPKAEACIEVCLEDLVAMEVDYTAAGLEFVLQRSRLLEDLRRVREVQFRESYLRSSERDTVRLSSVPVGRIFEAPSVLLDMATTGGKAAARCSNARNGLGIAGAGVSTSSTAAASTIKARRRSSSPYWAHDPTSPSSPLCVDMTPDTGSSKLDSAISARSPPTSLTPPATGTSYSEPKGSVMEKRWTLWHRQPPTPLTPPASRSQPGSVRTLADCMHSSERGKAKKVMFPRDAKGKHESVGELAMFLLLYAPETTGR